MSGSFSVFMKLRSLNNGLARLCGHLALLCTLTACMAPAADDMAATVAWVENRHPDIPHVAGETVPQQTAPDLLLLDVRSAEEYAVSHLPGAIRWTGSKQALQLIKEQQPKQIRLYCSVGERSSRAARAILKNFPQHDVANIRGGVFNWAIAGRSLVDQTGQGTDKVHPYDRQWGKLIPSTLRADLPTQAK